MTAFCRSRTETDPSAPRVDFRIEEDHVTLFLVGMAEEGTSAANIVRIARLRFDPHLVQWTLHYPVAGDRWSFYLNAGPSLDLGKLLDHLDCDPLHVFWPTTT